MAAKILCVVFTYVAIGESDRARHSQSFLLVGISYEILVQKAVTLILCADGKGRAAELYSAGKLKPFHLERWDLAHRATDFAKWAGASNFYDIQYEHVRGQWKFHSAGLVHSCPTPPQVHKSYAFAYMILHAFAGL